jgi:hypothetical protein
MRRLRASFIWPALFVAALSACTSTQPIKYQELSAAAGWLPYDRIDMLLILSDFEGLEPGAAFDREALGAQLRSVRHVRKYGVVGAPAFARAMIEVSDFLSPVDSKTFASSEEAAAWAWIET